MKSIEMSGAGVQPEHSTFVRRGKAALGAKRTGRLAAGAERRMLVNPC
jgi:hypothetical protein